MPAAMLWRLCVIICFISLMSWWMNSRCDRVRLGYYLRIAASRFRRFKKPTNKKRWKSRFCIFCFSSKGNIKWHTSANVNASKSLKRINEKNWRLAQLYSALLACTTLFFFYWQKISRLWNTRYSTSSVPWSLKIHCFGKSFSEACVSL